MVSKSNVTIKVPKHDKCRNQQLAPFKEMMLDGSRDYTFSQKKLILPLFAKGIVKNTLF